jgi:hypothetical protein
MCDKKRNNNLIKLWIKTNVFKIAKIWQQLKKIITQQIFITILNLTGKARNKIATNFALLTCQ